VAIEIVSFRKFEKNTLQGFVIVRMTSVGLEIRDCTLHEKDGCRWISLPSKPYTKEDGSTGYSYIVAFPEKRIYEQFQKATLAALDEYLKSVPKESKPDDIPF